MVESQFWTICFSVLFVLSGIGLALLVLSVPEEEEQLYIAWDVNQSSDYSVGIVWKVDQDGCFTVVDEIAIPFKRFL